MEGYNKELAKSAELLRHELASINMDDIQELIETRLSNQNVLERAGATETYYKAYLEKVLKLLLYEQLAFIGKEAINDPQTQFGRGTFNGITLVKDWMEKQVNISLARFDKNENKTGDDGVPKI